MSETRGSDVGMSELPATREWEMQSSGWTDVPLPSASDYKLGYRRAWLDAISVADDMRDELLGRIAMMEAENEALQAKGTPGWKRLRELESEAKTQDVLVASLTELWKKFAAERDTLLEAITLWRESENEPDDELLVAHDAYLAGHPDALPLLTRAERAEAALAERGS